MCIRDSCCTDQDDVAGGLDRGCKRRVRVERMTWSAQLGVTGGRAERKVEEDDCRVKARQVVDDPGVVCVGQSADGDQGRLVERYERHAAIRGRRWEQLFL